MGKFRFSDYTPAKLAKPANALDSVGYPSANNLLMSAKVKQEKQESPGTLANISNALAAQEPFKIKNLSDISSISRGPGINQKNVTVNIPPPEPSSLGPAYAKLWVEAWTLADQIDDDKGGISIEERRAMLPELERIRAELIRLENLGAHPPGSKIEQVKQPEIPKVQVTIPNSCPARCKISGRCYGRAYFLGKSGKSQDCIEPCLFSDQFETSIKKQREPQR